MMMVSQWHTVPGGGRRRANDDNGSRIGESDGPTTTTGAGWGRIGDEEVNGDREEEDGNGLCVKAMTTVCRWRAMGEGGGDGGRRVENYWWQRGLEVSGDREEEVGDGWWVKATTTLMLG